MSTDLAVLSWFQSPLAATLQGWGRAPGTAPGLQGATAPPAWAELRAQPQLTPKFLHPNSQPGEAEGAEAEQFTSDAHAPPFGTKQNLPGSQGLNPSSSGLERFLLVNSELF